VPDAQWRWWLNTPESTLFMPHLEHGVATFMLQVGGRRVIDQDLAGDEDTFLQWTQREQYDRPLQVLVGDAADELADDYFMFSGALYEVEREIVPLTGEIDEIYELERLRVRSEAEAAVRAEHDREQREVERVAPVTTTAAAEEGGEVEEARGPIADQTILDVWRRDGGRCVRCGSNEELAFDHIIPLSMGGSSSARNVQLLCEPCDRAKQANLS
jgi:5-methylcytosine-specific restriction endonuclease McrA